MRRTISNFGKVLNKKEQKNIFGGYKELDFRSCYDSPISNINCVSKWEYVHGCGWTCMIENLDEDIIPF